MRASLGSRSGLPSSACFDPPAIGLESLQVRGPAAAAALKLPVRWPMQQREGSRMPEAEHANRIEQPAAAVTAERPAPDPRVAVRLPARISTIDPETDPFTGKSFFRTTEETSANLSRGGLFVSMREAIPPGRRVLVELEMPGGRQLQTVGRIAWTRVRLDDGEPAGIEPGALEPGVGIEILGGPRDDLQQLERFVSRRLRRRTKPTGPKQDVATSR